MKNVLKAVAKATLASSAMFIIFYLEASHTTYTSFLGAFGALMLPPIAIITLVIMSENKE
jgi:hypothetical protein